jgi:hypothetical protein
MRLRTRAIRIIFVTLTVTASLGAQQSATADAERVKQRLIGSYKLISWTQYDANGQASKSPYTMGQISYDAAGRMSAHLMTEEQLRMAGGRGTQTGQQAQGGRGAGNATGYIAYYGRYEIDAARSIITHFVEGSTSLGLIGTGQVRYYELTPDGRTLFLSTKTGDRITGRLQWDRHQSQ